MLRACIQNVTDRRHTAVILQVQEKWLLLPQMTKISPNRLCLLPNPIHYNLLNERLLKSKLKYRFDTFIQDTWLYMHVYNADVYTIVDVFVCHSSLLLHFFFKFHFCMLYGFLFPILMCLYINLINFLSMFYYISFFSYFCL